MRLPVAAGVSPTVGAAQFVVVVEASVALYGVDGKVVEGADAECGQDGCNVNIAGEGFVFLT